MLFEFLKRRNRSDRQLLRMTWSLKFRGKIIDEHGRRSYIGKREYICSQMKEGSSGAFRAHNLKDLKLLKAKRGLKSSELDQEMNAVILC